MRYLALLVLAAAVPARADDASEPPRETPFDRGKLALTAGGGTSSNLGHAYVVIGAGVGYYGRAGGLWVSGKVVLGLGLAYEHIVSPCTDCDTIYPDVTISLAL